MSKNELELIELIRENDDPERALIVAFEVITGYLERHRSSQICGFANDKNNAGNSKSNVNPYGVPINQIKNQTNYADNQ